MTIWDKIYKNYRKGGSAWATLGEGLLPQFLKFVESNDFRLKSALDIGCGTGKYLSFLHALGFTTVGIDSSETAIEMSEKACANCEKLICVDMFDFQIPENTFDLVYSISTIHHGTKENISSLLNSIYKSLVDGGKIFITFPDVSSKDRWDTFKNFYELAPETRAPLSGPEKGLPHSFFSMEEIRYMLSSFRNVKMELDEKGRWIVTADK